MTSLTGSALFFNALFTNIFVLENKSFLDLLRVELWLTGLFIVPALTVKYKKLG